MGKKFDRELQDVVNRIMKLEPRDQELLIAAWRSVLDAMQCAIAEREKSAAADSASA